MSKIEKVIYHYKKSRKQRSLIFINMGIMCLVYIAGIHSFEYFFNKTIPEDTRNIGTIVLFISSMILFNVARWLRNNPATYEAIITTKSFTIIYPNSKIWSFKVLISDIKRFEHRNTLSHAGSGIGSSGILLNDGSFQEISMNYGNYISKMHKAVQSVREEVDFPKKVNQKITGPINKDYDQ
jgi:hypothetical protein